MSDIFLNRYYSDTMCCRIDFSCSIERLNFLLEDMQCMCFFDNARQENIDKFIELFEYVIQKKS